MHTKPYMTENLFDGNAYEAKYGNCRKGLRNHRKTQNKKKETHNAYEAARNIKRFFLLSKLTIWCYFFTGISCENFVALFWPDVLHITSNSFDSLR